MKQYRYPGAQPFSSTQEHIFFGRNQDVEVLYRSIRLEPLVVVHSKSGLGKSSLINAGLVPRVLKDNKYRPVSIRFNAYSSDNELVRFPLMATHASVVEACDSTGENTFLEKLLPEEDSLWYQLKREQAHLGDSQQLLLLFDQFEELFTYPEKAIIEFKKQLAEVLHTHIPQRFRKVVEGEVENPLHLTPQELALVHQPFEARIVFAIRSDRISLLDKLADHLPDVKRSWYELSALRQEQAEDAILNPAYKKGEFASPVFDYNDAAIEKMLGFLTKESSRKIESFQLQILCQAIERKVIQQQLTKITASDLGNIEEVYENYYDDQIRLIEDPAEQLSARRFIEEGLIFEEEKRRLSLYEGQIFSQFNISESLLAKLTDTHLIRRESSMKGGYTYELSHDTLVTPVLRAKGERLEEEGKVAAEQEREQKEQELTEARQKAEEERLLRGQAQQRTRLAAIVSGVALILALFAGWSYLKATQANSNVVKLILENADKDLLNLRYEDALQKFKAAASLGGFTNECTKDYLEIAFWYGEIGNPERASGILDSVALLIDESLERGRSHREAIESIDSDFYKVLMERYYPPMVEVKGGTFEMGCDSTIDTLCMDREVLHQQTVSSFQMAKYETTWWQYYLFIKVEGYEEVGIGDGKNGSHPVVDVNWMDAVEYCNWLSRRLGAKEAITTDSAGIYSVDLSTGYRLPTEAEWEFAAKGGNNFSETVFSGNNELGAVGWYIDNSDGSTHPVGGKEANALGLHDMSGNVWEWCWDWYSGYPSSPDKDYLGASVGGTKVSRVFRGGAWNYKEPGCRAAYRGGSYPNRRYNYTGFRLVSAP